MGSLLLGDLNDYIQPSQACVKPVDVQQKGEDGWEPKPVLINLGDCLACSGCITSTESVLVSLQTHSLLYDRLANRTPASLVVVSVSPQSVTALAFRYRLSFAQSLAKVVYFFRSVLGVDYVFDTVFARNFALLESAQDFVERVSTCLRHRESGLPEPATLLPMITSVCPGWICYVEKRYPDLLPHVSRSKSPQQIAGSLVKRYLPAVLGRENADVFHVTVMPCYDKKLEASRQDFLDHLTRTHDVDCVITTNELLQMLGERSSVPFADLPLGQLDGLLSAIGSDSSLYGHEGSGAGGYLEFALSFSVRHLFPHLLCSTRTNVIRSADFKEYQVVSAEGEVLLRFASIYGFRNIQTFVQRQRSKNYDFVEIMACPGACLNGGGQPPKPPSDDPEVSDREAGRRYLAELNLIYTGGLPPLSSIDCDPKIDAIYRWVGDRRDSMFWTCYRPVELESSVKKPAFNIQW